MFLQQCSRTQPLYPFVEENKKSSDYSQGSYINSSGSNALAAVITCKDSHCLWL